VPRNQYVEIRQEKPKNRYQQDAPEYKTCKFISEAIVADGTDKGELRKVCANPACPVHHPKRQATHADAAFKAEQDKRRREEALAQATGLRVLSAIGEAVPVRLMKRDLLFVVERLAALLDERRLAVLIRQHSMGKAKEADAPAKLLAAFLRKAEESTLGRLLVEIVILQSTQSQSESAKVLREAASVYRVDIEAITAQLKQDFAQRKRQRPQKKRQRPSPAPKAEPKPNKKAAA
jgi:ParB family chromosome partitioning protein